MGGVGFGGIHRADFRALGRIKVTDALDTLIGVDDVYRFSLADGLYRALWLTGSAADALVRDFISHSILPPDFTWKVPVNGHVLIEFIF
jgi:hypothetical protein